MNCKLIRYIIWIVAPVSAFIISPIIAGAQDTESSTTQSPFIEHFDQNGDGLVSADEFPGETDQFSELDADGNGYLDASEAPTGPPKGGPNHGDMMSEFDQDGDGQLSASEFPGPDDRFTDLDTDGDGYLSSEELENGRPGPPKDGKGGGFENDDADQDGKVSQAEFSGPADMFSELDADGDGYITQEEVRAAHPGPRP